MGKNHTIQKNLKKKKFLSLLVEEGFPSQIPP